MALTCVRNLEVIEPECDFTKRMTLANIMRHAQQMGSEHLEELGLGYDRLVQDRKVFLVSKLLMKIQRRPTYNDHLILTTIPKEPKGAQFIRDTYFDTREGERLLEVSIAWLLVDPVSRKILRPSAFDNYGLKMNPNDGEFITGYKIKAPGNPMTSHMHQVKYSELDYNGHVNNANYATIVCDSIPIELFQEREISEFGILYQKEATIGQIMELRTAPLQDGVGYYMGGMVEDHRCFEAEIKFF